MVLVVLGITSALALIIYVTFLGTQAPFYEFLRRFGIYFYFLFSVLAQIMLANQLIRLSTQLRLNSVLKVSRLQLWLALTPFALGALNLVLKSVLDDADSIENVIEWASAFMMQAYVVMSYLTWRDTGFGAELTIKPDSIRLERANS
jgi:hypothetical protein